MWLSLTSLAVAGTILEPNGIEVDLPPGWSWRAPDTFVLDKGATATLTVAGKIAGVPQGFWCDQGYAEAEITAMLESTTGSVITLPEPLPGWKPWVFIRDPLTATSCGTVPWSLYYGAPVELESGLDFILVLGNFDRASAVMQPATELVAALSTAKRAPAAREPTESVAGAPKATVVPAPASAPSEPYRPKREIIKGRRTTGYGIALPIYTQPFDGTTVGLGFSGGERTVGIGKAPVAVGGRLGIGHGFAKEHFWFDAEIDGGVGLWVVPGMAVELTAGLRCDTYGPRFPLGCGVPLRLGATVDVEETLRLHLAPVVTFMLSEERRSEQTILPFGDAVGLRWDVLVGDAVYMWTGGEWTATAGTNRVIITFGIGGTGRL